MAGNRTFCHWAEILIDRMQPHVSSHCFESNFFLDMDISLWFNYVTSLFIELRIEINIRISERNVTFGMEHSIKVTPNSSPIDKSWGIFLSFFIVWISFEKGYQSASQRFFVGLGLWHGILSEFRVLKPNRIEMGFFESWKRERICWCDVFFLHPLNGLLTYLNS